MIDDVQASRSDHDGREYLSMELYFMYVYFVQANKIFKHECFRRRGVTTFGWRLGSPCKVYTWWKTLLTVHEGVGMEIARSCLDFGILQNPHQCNECIFFLRSRVLHFQEYTGETK
jgi:hypothetical protein